MFKASAILIFLSAYMNCAFSQSSGNVDYRLSYSDLFSESNKATKAFGYCTTFGAWKALRISALEESEISIYNGYGCKNLVAKKNLCGAFTDKDFKKTFGTSGIFSIMVTAKKGACRYPMNNA
ncbi:hypothetical protein AYI70_g5621 [Smittium culicis]|uniref:Ecp2 effector protein domain-containing protein n=1 Tax=Smittium culicis TaxID=133412 RepID=A0A1R1XTM9_9FUNG|nr:hypothetical protein AYI70_g5621 [Smittium culicis]